ncbi:glycine-rich RNA-binding protein GRP1A-like [Lolium rigidum]|uniref:glycine-rich RNA-binding protein GRP1A-like n=1 Tax=Lolium rigidum TaxID=89674 RepID=UPI001F5C1C6F|nr:glycine-rich RNA-binding protein GRP1A-like [Lolium rigidum]
MTCPWRDDDFMNADVGHGGLTPTDERRAHVGNLPWRADSRSLIDTFANHGVRYAEVIVDRETGRSRGFGFVTFDDSKSMNSAIKDMNGQELGGRNITVSQANQRSRR